MFEWFMNLKNHLCDKNSCFYSKIVDNLDFFKNSYTQNTLKFKMSFWMIVMIVFTKTLNIQV